MSPDPKPSPTNEPHIKENGREEQRPDQPLKQIAETQDRAREEAEDDKTN